jgi:plasmid stabilization system protein ParE
MKITFDPGARADLDDIFAWISKDNEAAAYTMMSRIEARIALLATPGFEHMGRPGLDEGTRELIEYPYIIVYEVFESRGEIVVWSLVHGAQNRQPERP